MNTVKFDGVSLAPYDRGNLADHVGASINDVATWRDEALMLNLAAFGSTEHRLFIQAGFEGLADLLSVDLESFRKRPALFHITEEHWRAAARRHRALAKRLRVTIGWDGDIIPH